jgi:L,D-transpeptidase ErfK/SrfK
MRTSHGCIRMYPEDIEVLFGMVAKGTPVTVVNQPYLFGWHEGELVLQAYDVLEDDKRDWAKSRPKLLQKTFSKRLQKLVDERGEKIDWARVDEIANAPRGLAVSVTDPGHTVDTLVAAAPRVENRVPDGANWDGADDPARLAEAEARKSGESSTVAEQRQVPRS